VNRLFFMSVSFKERTLPKTGGVSGAQVKQITHARLNDE